jgi:hypothetical protein
MYFLSDQDVFEMHPYGRDKKIAMRWQKGHAKKLMDKFYTASKVLSHQEK